MQQADRIAALALALTLTLTLTLTLILIGAVAVPAHAAGGGTAAAVEQNVLPAPGAASGPRRLGYVVGDVIDRHIWVRPLAGSSLEPESLPRLGVHNAWLELIGASVRAPGGQAVRYEIDLRYQLINAPAEVRSLALPAVQLRFTRAAGMHDQVAAGELPVRIAPLLPAQVPVSAALVRPDRSPAALSRTPALLTAGLSALLAIAAAAALIAQPFLKRRNAPFARACRHLERAARRAGQGAAGGEYRPALRAVHRAFDQTAGWSLFPDRTGDFLAQSQQFSSLRAGIERFMDLSQREFFEPRSQQEPQGQRDNTRELRWLVEFAHQCRASERQAS